MMDPTYGLWTNRRVVVHDVGVIIRSQMSPKLASKLRDPTYGPWSDTWFVGGF